VSSFGVERCGVSSEVDCCLTGVLRNCLVVGSFILAGLMHCCKFAVVHASLIRIKMHRVSCRLCLKFKSARVSAVVGL